MDLLAILFSNSFWIGLGTVGFGVLLGAFFYFGGTSYTPNIGRLLSIIHTIGFCIMGYGVGLLSMQFGFQNTWWETMGYVASFGMAFGAILEARKPFPLGPKLSFLDACKLLVSDIAETSKEDADVYVTSLSNLLSSADSNKTEPSVALLLVAFFQLEELAGEKLSRNYFLEEFEDTARQITVALNIHAMANLRDLEQKGLIFHYLKQLEESAAKAGKM